MTEISTREMLAVSMMNLVADIARALVDHPDKVSVRYVLEKDSTALQLRVSPADLGKVIGKQGRTARSMRTILSAASMKAQFHFSLDIQRVEGEFDSDSPEGPIHLPDPEESHS